MQLRRESLIRINLTQLKDATELIENIKHAVENYISNYQNIYFKYIVKNKI